MFNISNQVKGTCVSLIPQKYQLLAILKKWDITFVTSLLRKITNASLKWRLIISYQNTFSLKYTTLSVLYSFSSRKYWVLRRITALTREYIRKHSSEEISAAKYHTLQYIYFQCNQSPNLVHFKMAHPVVSKKNLGVILHIFLASRSISKFCQFHFSYICQINPSHSISTSTTLMQVTF